MNWQLAQEPFDIPQTGFRWSVAPKAVPVESRVEPGGIPARRDRPWPQREFCGCRLGGGAPPVAIFMRE